MNKQRELSDYNFKDYTILSQLKKEKMLYEIKIKRHNFFDFIFPCDFLYNRSYMFKLSCLLQEYHEKGLVKKVQYVDESFQDYNGNLDTYYTYILSEKGNSFINSNNYSFQNTRRNIDLIPIRI